MPDAPGFPALIMGRQPAYRRIPEAERQSDLIDATLDCIADLGLHGATFREIARRAGVTSGLLAHHFETKEQLLQAAYRKVVATLTDRTIDDDGSAEDRLRRFIIANLTAPVSNNRNLVLWSAFISQVSLDPMLAAIHRDGYLSFRTTLQRLIAEFLALRGKPVAPDRSLALATALNALMDGLWLEGRLASDLFAKDELVAIALTSAESLLGVAFQPTPLPPCPAVTP